MKTIKQRCVVRCVTACYEVVIICILFSYLTFLYNMYNKGHTE